MFTVVAFTHLVEGLALAHRKRRNDAIMRELPEEIRKDIGWPFRFTAPRLDRRPLGRDGAGR